MDEDGPFSEGQDPLNMASGKMGKMGMGMGSMRMGKMGMGMGMGGGDDAPVTAPTDFGAGATDPVIGSDAAAAAIDDEAEAVGDPHLSKSNGAKTDLCCTGGHCQPCPALA